MQGTGHRHVSRRQALAMLGGTAGAIALGELGGHAHAARAATEDRRPRPIPLEWPTAGSGWHFQFNDHTTAGDKSTPIFEQSSITDFDGIICSTHMQGTGTGTDRTTSATMPLVFDADIRFMEGTYVGMDGQRYQDTFGFI